VYCGARSTANNAAKANDPNTQEHITAAQQTAGAAQSDVNKAGELAASEIAGQKSGFDTFVEKLDPWAQANEWAHIPLDVSASGKWLDPMLEQWAKSAEKGVNAAKNARTALDSTLQQAFSDEVGSVAHDFDNGLASMSDVESAFTKYDQGAKAAISAADGAVSGAETGLNIAKAAGVASKVMGGLSIAGDVMTIVKPEDSGTMGTVDRVAAGANAAGTATALLAANASADWIPGVGEVVAAGTGVYLAGDFLYHHWTPFRNVCNTVGSGIATGATTVAHGVSSAAHWVAGLF
jgi:hypothetical protein